MAQGRAGELRVDPRDRVASRGGTKAGKPRTKRTGGSRRRAGRFLWRWSLFFALWGLLFAGAALAYFALTLPPTSDLTVAERRPSMTIVASDGSLIATYGDLFGEPLRLKDLPPYVGEAVVATEDHRFYHHFGLDPIGLARAAFANWRAGHVVEGGSTITQQLAKNLFLSPERTLRRKIQEALLALWLEHKFSKGQILEIYLNRVYLGAGTYGVDAAARRYFNKSARSLSLYEAAVIAGLLKAPTRFSPARDQARAAERADQVLTRMVEAGYISEAQATQASAQRTLLATAARAVPGTRYFADWVADQAAGIAALHDHDLVIVTTLDARLQAAAERAIAETLEREGEKAAVEQGALVAMSPDGAVRAMVGGRDYGESQYNRATQALRQPGSSFKPIVYLAALERGVRPSDRFIDQPIRIGKWQPHNYENTYRGEVTVADALAASINTVAAQVLERAGVDQVITVARRLGITADLARDASLALGTSEVSLTELTAAYAAFASGGIGAWPHGIVEIRDPHAGVLYRRDGPGPGRVIDPALAGEMNQMLTQVLVRGTGKVARLDRPAAGKTGTTQDFHDALFIGYTADLVAGVWLGNDDNAPMRHVTGGTLPARTWHAFMTAASEGTPVRPLPSPESAPATPVGEGSLTGLIDAILAGDNSEARQGPRAR